MHTNPRTSSVATIDHDDPCGVFVIDATGLVIAANSSAREYVEFRRKTLASLSFVDLLHGASSGTDGGPGASDWKSFVASALDRWTTLRMRTPDGERELRLRLERSAGGAGSYIATLRRA
jgi:hypothetical protein